MVYCSYVLGLANKLESHRDWKRERREIVYKSVDFCLKLKNRAEYKIPHNIFQHQKHLALNKIYSKHSNWPMTTQTINKYK